MTKLAFAQRSVRRCAFSILLAIAAFTLNDQSQLFAQQQSGWFSAESIVVPHAGDYFQLDRDLAVYRQIIWTDDFLAGQTVPTRMADNFSPAAANRLRPRATAQSTDGLSQSQHAVHSTAETIPANIDQTSPTIALASHQEEVVDSNENPDTDEVPAESDEPIINDAILDVQAGPAWFDNPVISFSSAWMPIDIDPLKVEKLGERIEDLEALASAKKLDDEKALLKLQTIKELHRQASENLNNIKTLQKSIKTSPDKLKQLQDQLAKPLPEAPGTLDESLSIEAHEAGLVEHQKHIDQLRQKLAQAEGRIETRGEDFVKLDTDETASQEIITQATEQLGDWPKQDLVAQIEFTELQAKIIASKIELRRISLQRQAMTATEKVRFLDRDVLKRQLEQAQLNHQSLSNLVAARRDEIVQAEAEKARQEATDAHPIVRELAEQVAYLAECRTKLSTQSREVGIEHQQLRSLLDNVESTQKKLDEHVEAAGHSRSVGLMLRLERRNVPPTDRHQQRLGEIENDLTELAMQRLEVKADLDQLDNQETDLKEALSTANATDDSVESLLAKANDLFSRKRDYLYELQNGYDKHSSELLAIRKLNQDLVSETVELRTFIDQHVLWIRSAEPMDSSDFRRSWLAIQAIGKTDQWQTLANTVSSKLTARWPILLMIAAGLWLAFGMRQELNRRLRRVCARQSEFRITPLVRSFLMTFFQASFLPAVVGTFGWLLNAPYDTESMRDSLSRGILLITPQLFIASWIYRVAIRGGLAESHFGWSKEVCDRVRTAAATIGLYCLPLLALVHTLEVFENGAWNDSLGRILFILAMIVLSIASFRMLRGLGRAWKTDPESSHSVWEQTFPLWAPVLVILPIALACVSALGYMYSSVFLGSRLLLTWWLILGSVCLYFLLSRIKDIGHNIIVARRRWRASRESNDNHSRGQLLDTEANAIRLQVNRLLHVSTIGICLLVAFSFWAEAIPAIKAFDYGLWQVTRQVNEMIGDKAVVNMVPLTITVGDVLKALMILLATFVLSRNLPGLLQMLILDRLPLDRGAKYAISIVCRYIVAAFGLVMASSVVGFTWSSVQWLVAAMGVGLGFGLQEIFANFVAGIIILFERPIRVGDFVTVNGTTGTVTRIQLRATMIEDYDRRELIVPNKKFITDDVINWTLSDTVTRVVVPVGIAYGSDTKKAQSALLKVARLNSLVLNDPAPDVLFAKFGDSTLDFELRVHILNRESFPDVVHQLHMAIDEEFRLQDIEIAFPQTDINVKGLRPLVESLSKPTATRRKKAG